MKKGQYRKEYIAFARQIEERYGARTSVIALDKKSRFPWATSSEEHTLFIIEPQKDNARIFQQVRQELEQAPVPNRFLVQPMYPTEELAQLLEEKPELIRSNLGAMGFLVPFFFHREVHGHFQQEVQTHLQERFGKKLEHEIEARKKRLAESDKNIRKAIRQRQKEERITGPRTIWYTTPDFATARKHKQLRTKLISPAEQKELIQQFQQLAERVHKTNPDLLIALDQSGRPVGTTLTKILQQAHGKSIPLFFLDPHYLIQQNAKPQTTQKVFERDHPILSKKIRGARIMLLDDQMAHGRNLLAVHALLTHYQPAEIMTGYLSRYPDKPAPSWWYQKPFITSKARGRSLVVRRRRTTVAERQRAANFRKALQRLAQKTASRIRRH